MKRRILLVLVMTVLIFSACKKNENKAPEITTAESYVVAQDAGYMFQENSNKSFIAKSEDGYYFLLNNIVYHADEDLNMMALCNKPNCLHALEPVEDDRKNCKGYMGSTTLAHMYYYNDKVYVLSVEDIFKGGSFWEEGILQRRLYRINEDGTGKELVEGFASKLDIVLFHRGYIYYSNYRQEKVQEDNEEKILTYVSWYRMDIETGEKEELIGWDNVELNEIQEIRGYRNYVYCSTLSNIYVYSILENRIVNELKINISELPGDMTYGGETNVEKKPIMEFMDDKLLLRYATDNHEMFVSDLEGNNLSYAFSLQSKWNNVGADDRYIYEDNRLSDEALRDGKRILRYYDKNTYEHLGEIKLDGASYRRLGYGDEKYFFFLKEYDEETFSVMYFEKENIGTDDFEIKELFRILKVNS